jgi:uncharacterized protein (TIGR02266 family)
MSEQRAHRRHQVNEAYDGIGEFAVEYVTNISRTGVFIRSRTPHPVGTHVELRFSVYLDDFHIIEGEGEVVRVVPDGHDAGMGVVFTRLTEASRLIIDQVADRQEASGG